MIKLLTYMVILTSTVGLITIMGYLCNIATEKWNGTSAR